MMTDRDSKWFMYWRMEYEIVAGSASFVIDGYPDAQVTVLRNLLRRAAADGMNLRNLYNTICQDWCTWHPRFPTSDAMTA